VTLTAVADPGWQFVGWSGDLTGLANPSTLVMDADKSVLATFIPIVIPPSITNQTGSLTANAGDTVVFSVTASGTAPLAYQWRKGGDDVAGATGTSLTFSPVQPSDAGSYSVEVSNAAGVATSAPASLIVAVPPTFLLQERFADGTRAGQSLPASAAWWGSSSNFTATAGQATMSVTSSRTLLAYFTNAEVPVREDLRYRVVQTKNLTMAGSGTTLNMGSRGILFTTQEKLPMGRMVEISVNWPARLDGTCPLQFVVQGRVVRSEDHRAAVVNCRGSLQRLQRPSVSFIRTRVR
jgi:hypothetical protein